MPKVKLVIVCFVCKKKPPTTKYDQEDVCEDCKKILEDLEKAVPAFSELGKI